MNGKYNKHVDSNLPDITKENPDVNTLCDAVGHYYKGQKVQVYWADSGGQTNYSDFDIANLIYIEGTVLWGRGTVLALEAEVNTSTNNFKTIVMFTEQQLCFVSPLDSVDIMYLFKGYKGRLKVK